MTLSDLWVEYDRLAPSDSPTDWTRKAVARQAIEDAIRKDEQQKFRLYSFTVDGTLKDAEDAIRKDERERMVAMRRDYETMPHAQFPIKWPDWKAYEVVLPTYCGCSDCRLWRSGS